MSADAFSYVVGADSKRGSTSSPKDSFESARSASAVHESALKRAAKKITKALKEHHNSVNAAVDALYGPRILTPSPKF
jgi:hypothetical protein